MTSLCWPRRNDADGRDWFIGAAVGAMQTTVTTVGGPEPPPACGSCLPPGWRCWQRGVRRALRREMMGKADSQRALLRAGVCRPGGAGVRASGGIRMVGDRKFSKVRSAGWGDSASAHTTAFGVEHVDSGVLGATPTR